MSDYDVWAQARHDWDNDEWLERRPVCSTCHEHIQDDHYYQNGGKIICPKCMEEWLEDHRREIEDDE